eukprot:2853501-Rhodomonas_salina.9
MGESQTATPPSCSNAASRSNSGCSLTLNSSSDVRCTTMSQTAIPMTMTALSAARSSPVANAAACSASTRSRAAHTT